MHDSFILYGTNECGRKRKIKKTNDRVQEIHDQSSKDKVKKMRRKTKKKIYQIEIKRAIKKQ